jgi:hypothetical protein
MDAQQSPDKDNSRLDHAAQLAAEETARGEPGKAYQREVTTIRDDAFVLSLLMRPDGSNRLDSITVEVLSRSGTLVATYQTTSSIPPWISKEAVKLSKALEHGIHPKRLLSEIVLLLAANSAVEWNLSSPPSPPAAQGGPPRFTSVIPTLLDFAERPQIVDEHLTATIPTERGFDRLTVKMSPNLGFMRCIIEGDEFSGQPREWKIRARLDRKLEEGLFRQDLSLKANELLIRLYLDGGKSLVDLLDGGHFGAQACPIPYKSSSHIDTRLSRGFIDVADKSTELLHSRAKVFLRLGTRFAVIRVVPCPDDFSQAASVVFDCGSSNPELNVLQLDYIEMAYKLLTSSNAGERYRGAQMCSPKQSGLEYFRVGYQPAKEASPLVYSLLKMDISYWSPTPNLEALIGESHAYEINSLQGMNIVVPQPGSWQDIAIMLEGGRRILAERLERELSPGNRHLFRDITCILHNNGSIGVTLHNRIGGVYHAVIDGDRVRDESSQAAIIASLFASFARSTGGAWTAVVGEIENLSGQSAADVELRLGDPQYQNIPPFEDRMGALMLAEAVKLSAFVSADAPSRRKLTSEIRYAGLGSAHISFSREGNGPTFEFLVQDNELREVVITKTKADPERPDPRAITLYRFRADGITLNSEHFFEILEAAHNFAGQLVPYPYDNWYRQAFPQLLEPFVAVLSARMNRVFPL